MAIYRSIRLEFWTDTKIVDDFTPEDKYFYLYLMTNPHTNLCGCYEISMKQASVETGYSKDTIESLLDRFEHVHHVISYSNTTKEVLLLNWSKFNWTKSKDFQKSLAKEITEVKDVDFKRFLENAVDGVGTVSRPSQDGVGTSVTVTDTVSDTVSDTDTDNNDDFMETVREIVSYLNETIGTQYKPTSGYIKKLIHARLEDKFTVDDFKTVIWKKAKEWKGTKFEQYLRPQTLFGTKFESYLNQSGEIRGGDKPYGAEEVEGFYQMMEEWANDE